MKNRVQYQLQRTPARSKNRIKADLTACERGYRLRLDTDDCHGESRSERYRKHSDKRRYCVLPQAAPNDKQQANVLFHTST